MSLSRWQRSIVTESGDTIAEAEIEVFDAGESTKPDLFQDSDGSTALTNPFNADGSGFAAFYVAGGRYDIAVNGAVIWTDVALGTVQSRDVGTGSDQVPDISALESALGIDPEGPAGADVLAAVGRGAIVESDTNDNGSYVRWENGEQVTQQMSPTIQAGAGTNDVFDREVYPADFVEVTSKIPGGINRLDGLHNFSAGFWPFDIEPTSSSDTGRIRLYDPSTSVEVQATLTTWGFWK